MTAAERIFQVLDQDPAVKEAPEAVHRRIEGAVEFRGVSFGYEAHNPVLHEVSFKIEPGEMIGLVGHSGAGKSTLINLICRFYDPDEGEILVDGVNLKDYAQTSLRSQIGVVLQESFLFSGTILENIAYARPDASLEEVIRAAKIANAHDFIIRFPNGYDTRVGERGQLLSVGERQRISIARAVLRDPRILILDEATASVDSETEMQIQQALARLVKNRTTFVIAHRLSTLRNANRVVVIDKGRIAEFGTHEELIRQRGIYYKLVMAQLELSRIKGY
jgi:ATP-binding cassette subfamily B protein